MKKPAYLGLPLEFFIVYAHRDGLFVIRHILIIIKLLVIRTFNALHTHLEHTPRGTRKRKDKKQLTLPRRGASSSSPKKYPPASRFTLALSSVAPGPAPYAPCSSLTANEPPAAERFILRPRDGASIRGKASGLPPPVPVPVPVFRKAGLMSVEEVSLVVDGPASSASAAMGFRKANRPMWFLPSIESWSCAEMSG